jgi:hypothetical protein
VGEGVVRFGVGVGFGVGVSFGVGVGSDFFKNSVFWAIAPMRSTPESSRKILRELFAMTQIVVGVHQNILTFCEGFKMLKRVSRV